MSLLTYHPRAPAQQWAAPLKPVFYPTDTPHGSARPPPQCGTERTRGALSSRPRPCARVRAPPTPEEWLPTVNGKLTEHVQSYYTHAAKHWEALFRQISINPVNNYHPPSVFSFIVIYSQLHTTFRNVSALTDPTSTTFQVHGGSYGEIKMKNYSLDIFVTRLRFEHFHLQATVGNPICFIPWRFPKHNDNFFLTLGCLVPL